MELGIFSSRALGKGTYPYMSLSPSQALLYGDMCGIKTQNTAPGTGKSKVPFTIYHFNIIKCGNNINLNYFRSMDYVPLTLLFTLLSPISHNYRVCKCVPWHRFPLFFWMYFCIFLKDIHGRCEIAQVQVKVVMLGGWVRAP